MALGDDLYFLGMSVEEQSVVSEWFIRKAVSTYGRLPVVVLTFFYMLAGCLLPNQVRISLLPWLFLFDIVVFKSDGVEEEPPAVIKYHNLGFALFYGFRRDYA